MMMDGCMNMLRVRNAEHPIRIKFILCVRMRVTILMIMM